MHTQSCAQLEALRADHRVGVGEAEHAVLQIALHQIATHESMAAEEDVLPDRPIPIAVAAEVVDAQSMPLVQPEDELHPPLIEMALQAQVMLRIQKRSGGGRRGIQVQVGVELCCEKSAAQREMIR